MFRILEEIIFKHVVELLIFAGLLMLLTAVSVGLYTQMQDRHHVASAHTNLKTLVDALQLYSYDYPAANVFPPESIKSEGIYLCPVRDNNQKGLAFLTTPTAYVSVIPDDPFMEQSMGQQFRAPAVLHWVRMNKISSHTISPYTHIGWGAMSVGPALKLPPQYNIQVLQHVPYTNELLERNLFDPSNGINSFGLLYYDSLGNSSVF